MSHSDYLQLLRDQNKHLLQKLRVERLRAPWNVLLPPESGDGTRPTDLHSAQNRFAADSQRNSNGNKFEQEDASSLKNPNLKDQADSELPGEKVYDDGSQQPGEVVVTESQKGREASRAALYSPSTRRAKQQSWTLGAGDAAGMELIDWLPDGEAGTVPNIEPNCFSSIGMLPKGSLIPEEKLSCERGKVKSQTRPRSIPCKLLTDDHVSKHLKCSTPFTKPPSAPSVTREPEPPILGHSSTGGANYNGNTPMHHSRFLQSLSEDPKPRSKLEPSLYMDWLLDEGNDRHREQFIRDTQKPKSILLESHSKVAKADDVGHVTFLSPKEESSLRAEVQARRPFLGYDWIAGLMDIDSPMSEKSEQYFMELQDFRRVNKEECVHQEYMEAEELDVPAMDQEKLDYNRHIHQFTLTVLIVACLQSHWNQQQPVPFAKLLNQNDHTLWRSLLIFESASPDQPCSLHTNTSHTVGRVLIPLTACHCRHIVFWAGRVPCLPPFLLQTPWTCAAQWNSKHLPHRWTVTSPT
ncbi:uncharacterized protein miip isoform X7 [Scyliorhinus torazame]